MLCWPNILFWRIAQCRACRAKHGIDLSSYRPTCAPASANVSERTAFAPLHGQGRQKARKHRSRPRLRRLVVKG
jgi:hypothetical protein